MTYETHSEATKPQGLDESPKLSPKSKLMLTLSRYHGSNWKPCKRSLMSELNMGAREADSCVAELESLGYLSRVPSRKANGQWHLMEWSWSKKRA